MTAVVNYDLHLTGEDTVGEHLHSLARIYHRYGLENLESQAPLPIAEIP